VKLKLKSVQTDEDTVVEQLSSNRLVSAQERVTRALKGSPDGTEALHARLDMLEKVKDRADDNNDLLRDNLETPADDDDAAMRVLMEKLGQKTQANFEAAPPLPVRPEPVRNNNEQWQPVYE
jgi:hypothetical protein